MRLYLVQHADAVSKDTHPLRPLSKKGLQDATNMAAFLHGASVQVDLVVHSGKLRAEETANVLANTVWPGLTPEAFDGIMPKDDTDHLLNNALTAGGDLMVVGHMPFMGRMAARCLTGSEDGINVTFEPGAVLCLERQDETWSLEWFMKPSMVGESGGDVA
ncbi:MAG TPA: phosphohistidine phosphatase SixA [Magnetovibrio sp.]